MLPLLPAAAPFSHVAAILQQEVGCQGLILVAQQERLHAGVALKAQRSQPAGGRRKGATRDKEGTQ